MPHNHAARSAVNPPVSSVPSCLCASVPSPSPPSHNQHAHLGVARKEHDDHLRVSAQKRGFKPQGVQPKLQNMAPLAPLTTLDATTQKSAPCRPAQSNAGRSTGPRPTSGGASAGPNTRLLFASSLAFSLWFAGDHGPGRYNAAGPFLLINE